MSKKTEENQKYEIGRWGGRRGKRGERGRERERERLKGGVRRKRVVEGRSEITKMKKKGENRKIDRWRRNKRAE
eukprot:979875-Amorphochlora_amoeboformis.AAC.1